MASDRLVRFAAFVNAGSAEGEAARKAGYSETTAKTKLAGLRERARAAGLMLTEAEARAPVDAIRAKVTDADWRAIAERAVEDAKAGDARAREWLSDRLMGKPPQSVEHSGPGGGPQRVEVVVRREDRPIRASQ